MFISSKLRSAVQPVCALIEGGRLRFGVRPYRLSAYEVEPLERRMMLSSTPAWLATTSNATFDPATHVLTVTGPTTIIANPGSDAPLITASGTNAALSIAPSNDTLIQLGSLTLTGGASAEITRPNAANFDPASGVVVDFGTSGENSPALSIDSNNNSTLGLEDNHLLVRRGTPDELDYILGLAVQAPGMSSPETLTAADYAQDAMPIAGGNAGEQLTVAGQSLPVSGGDLLVGFDALPSASQQSSSQAMRAGPAVPAGFVASASFTAQSSQQPSQPLSGIMPAEVSSVVINGNDSALVGPQRSMIKTTDKGTTDKATDKGTHPIFRGPQIKGRIPFSGEGNCHR